jgi:hypothetical protein
METKQEISYKKERKKTASCAGKNVFSSMSSFGRNPFYFFIFNHPPYFSTFSIWSLVQKGFKLACNWSLIFKHFAIVSLQTRAKKKSFSRQESLLPH